MHLVLTGAPVCALCLLQQLSPVTWRWVNKIVILGSCAYSMQRARLTTPHEVDPRFDEMDGSGWTVLSRLDKGS